MPVETKIKEIKDKLEALLFASGRKMDLDELSRLVKTRNRDIVKAALVELKGEIEAKQNTLVLIEDNNTWKLTIKEQYIDLVRQINTNTEISKTIIETLAVIAWKQPMLQCDVIKIRTNKAYDHIAELMEQGFVVKEKYGRTYLLKLTQKFFEYFDVRNDESLKALFKDISEEVLNKKKVDESNKEEVKNIEDAKKEEIKNAEEVKKEETENVEEAKKTDNNDIVKTEEGTIQVEDKVNEKTDNAETVSTEPAAEIKENTDNLSLPADIQAAKDIEAKKQLKIEMAVEQTARIKELMERAKAAIDGTSANAAENNKEGEGDGDEGDDGDGEE